MRIASARASTRSTVSTTSAASDEAVAPRAASATPTPAAASRWSVVDAVPDHDRLAVRRLPLDRRQLVRRVAIGQHGVDADDTADHVGDVRPITGDQDDARDTGRAQRSHHPGRVRPDRILEQKCSGGFAVDGDEDRQ